MSEIDNKVDANEDAAAVRQSEDDMAEAMPWHGKAVLLVDLDAFFASVEQLDHPAWRGKPVIVGGDPHRRGVVSTASYEARTYGVHSAMPSSTAARLCPDAIWTEGHYARYREMSNKVMDILRDETPFVEQVSIDEAFLDVTPARVNREHPISIARRIRQRVSELGVTCSIGVGTTKSVAKLASDMDKPNGLTVVFPGGERSFMAPMPVQAMSGIGKSSAARLKQMGITTLGELADASDEDIIRVLGKNGRTMLARARCEEEVPIVEDDEVKSVSNETSFAEDIVEREAVMAAIGTMAAKVGRRLRKKGLQGKQLALKVKYANLKARSVQRQLPAPTNDENDLIREAGSMLDELWSPGIALRLVGIAVSNFGALDEDCQMSLFDETAGVVFSEDGILEEEQRERSEPVKKRAESLKELSLATDRVRDRFGENAISYGRELRTRANTTGSSSKNPADYK